MLFLKILQFRNFDCRKGFNEKHNKNRSQINELVDHYLIKSSSKTVDTTIKTIWP